MRFWHALGVGILLWAGCAADKARNSQSPAPAVSAPVTAPVPAGDRTNTKPDPGKSIVTPDSSLTGRVALVNSRLQYVVIQFPIGALPVPGRVMHAYRGGLKVAEIKISNAKRDFNVIGDITTGECRVGDEVREN